MFTATSSGDGPLRHPAGTGHTTSTEESLEPARLLGGGAGAGSPKVGRGASAESARAARLVLRGLARWMGVGHHAVAGSP